MLLLVLLLAGSLASPPAKVEDVGTERCVVVEQAALWDMENASVPSSLSPAVKGDRLRVAEVRGSWARVTAVSFSPRFAWVAVSSLKACEEATEKKIGSFLREEIVGARKRVRRLRKRVLRCGEDDALCFERGQKKLVRAMSNLSRLCNADPACAAARRGEFIN